MERRLLGDIQAALALCLNESLADSPFETSSIPFEIGATTGAIILESKG